MKEQLFASWINLDQRPLQRWLSNLFSEIKPAPAAIVAAPAIAPPSQSIACSISHK